jgi:hypothetical protein
MSVVDPERIRLEEARTGQKAWRKWGPYLSERQWGTVREDYSIDGSAWDYFPHDHARSRAYRWGEDGLAGFSDDKQRLCFCLGLWNGMDPILKERLFGLTNSEGNHGEDVKEYYFYLDSTPTHSYAKFLYKYPQRAYPYDEIVLTNLKRTRTEQEYELIDTGIFDDDRYFDVFVEYAKDSPDELLIQITVCNRGPEAASLHVLPQWWFRNTWSWRPTDSRPSLVAVQTAGATTAAEARHDELGTVQLEFDGKVELLFTENETNEERVFGKPNNTPYVKDAFDRYLVHGKKEAVNPAHRGTKLAAHYELTVPAKGQLSVKLRLRGAGARSGPPGFGAEFDAVFQKRRRESDDYYASLMPPRASDDERNVIRQSLAGMLWSKQYYFFSLDEWLAEHGHAPLLGKMRPGTRNAHWFHMHNDEIISMPDKWEYPWYAAWDLAFHTLALEMVDPDFAKEQLLLLLNESYLHPNGQIPAYEWNFGDVNPPVHAFAALFSYNMEKQARGKSDTAFLKNVFQKLVLNFSWWANRKDPRGRNVFEGGFLGLDNIGVFDRSAPLPTGGFLEQADGTAWMAMYSLQLFTIALELAEEDASYEGLAVKFAEHFFWIAGSMDRAGENQDELWDEEDGFFYDVLNLPGGEARRLQVRSMVGLLPLCATSVVSAEVVDRFPNIRKRIGDFFRKYPTLVGNLHSIEKVGEKGRRLFAVCDETKLRRILTRMLDEARFLGPHGIRSLSRWHLEHPFELDVHGEKYTVQYQPAESQSGMFGGNSNWRGPVWFPINLLIISALSQFYQFYGESFKIECPTGSGHFMNLHQVAQELSARLVGTFLRRPDGTRPVYGDTAKFQNDPYWRDLLLFYEYFHGDNGAGIGASHQTGWTGTVTRLVGVKYLEAQAVLEHGIRGAALKNAAAGVNTDRSDTRSRDR